MFCTNLWVACHLLSECKCGVGLWGMTVKTREAATLLHKNDTKICTCVPGCTCVCILDTDGRTPIKYTQKTARLPVLEENEERSQTGCQERQPRHTRQQREVTPQWCLFSFLFLSIELWNSEMHFSTTLRSPRGMKLFVLGANAILNYSQQSTNCKICFFLNFSLFMKCSSAGLM